MPRPRAQRDLRIEAKLQKRIITALDALSSDTAALAEQWRGLPEKARPDVLAHSPTLARLVEFARRFS